MKKYALVLLLTAMLIAPFAVHASTLADLQAQLAALQAQIAVIQSQISAITSTNTVTNTVAVPTVTKKSGTLSLVSVKGVSQIKASFSLKITNTTGATIYLPQSYHPIAPNFVNTVRNWMGTTNNCTFSTYATNNLPVVWDSSKTTSYLQIANGQNVDYTAITTCPVNEMFAGNYTAQISNISWAATLGTDINSYIQNSPINIVSDNSKLIVGEQGPYISGVTFDNSNRTVVITGERLNKFSLITVGTLQFTPAMIPAWITSTSNKIIIQEAKNWPTGSVPVTITSLVGKSNTVSLTVGGGSNNQIGTPIANFTGGPIALTNGNIGAAFSGTVTASGGDVYLLAGYPFGVQFVNEKADYNVWANSCTVKAFDYGANLPTTVDRYGQQLTIIKNGTSAQYKVEATCSVNQLFAGVYHAELSHLNYYPVASDQSSASLPIKVKSNNSTYLVGEQGPYISSVSSVQSGQTVTITGERMKGSQVVIKGSSYAPSDFNFLADGKKITFTAKEISSTNYQVYLVSPLFGQSNTVGFTITAGNNSVQPKLTVTAPAGVTYNITDGYSTSCGANCWAFATGASLAISPTPAGNYSWTGCDLVVASKETVGNYCVLKLTSDRNVSFSKQGQTQSNGSLSVTQSAMAPLSQTLKKGDTNKVVIATKLTAVGGAMNVNRFDVHFTERPWLNLSQVTLKDSNGTIIATKTLTGAADATEVTPNSNYLVRFENVNYIVTPGTDVNLGVYVSVRPVTSFMTGQTVGVSIPTGSIRTVNSQGIYDSYGLGSATAVGGANVNSLLMFGSINTAGFADLAVTLSPNSALTGSISISKTVTTPNVKLATFRVKSSTAASTINGLTFGLGQGSSLSSGTASNVSNVRLKDDSTGQTYSATSYSPSGLATFSNLRIPLVLDTAKDLSLVVDVPANSSNFTIAPVFYVSDTVAVDANYNTPTINGVPYANTGLMINGATLTMTSNQSSSVQGYMNISVSPASAKVGDTVTVNWNYVNPPAGAFCWNNPTLPGVSAEWKGRSDAKTIGLTGSQSVTISSVTGNEKTPAGVALSPNARIFWVACATPGMASGQVSASNNAQVAILPSAPAGANGATDLTCQSLYYKDPTNQACGYKQFCGNDASKQGLKTYNTMSACQADGSVSAQNQQVTTQIENLMATLQTKLSTNYLNYPGGTTCSMFNRALNPYPSDISGENGVVWQIKKLEGDKNWNNGYVTCSVRPKGTSNYCVIASLPSDRNRSYCIDSTGFAGELAKSVTASGGTVGCYNANPSLNNLCQRPGLAVQTTKVKQLANALQALQGLIDNFKQ